LNALKEEKLWQQGAYKAYHIQLSDIIREYLENRFDIPVMESTTDEIKHLLRQKNLEKSLRDQVISALRISDLAKFAKAIPLPDENEFCMATGYSLVENTQVEPEKTTTHE
jgi:activator of HSP90 ATPase